MRTATAAAAAILGGVALWAWANGDGTLGGVTARTSLILAAVWLAWPSLTRISVRSTSLVAVGIGLLLWRPRAAWVVLPVLAVVLGRPPAPTRQGSGEHGP